METIDQYAASIVEKYHIEAAPESASHRFADKLAPVIKQWGKQFLAGVTVSGAYATVALSRLGSSSTESGSA